MTDGKIKIMNVMNVDNVMWTAALKASDELILNAIGRKREPEPCADCGKPAVPVEYQRVVERPVGGALVVVCCEACYRAGQAPKPTDPLDVIIDGVPLRDLLARDDMLRREPERYRPLLTPAQRAAVSAHWSAELRAKVAATAAADREREQRRVLVNLEDE